MKKKANRLNHMQYDIMLKLASLSHRLKSVSSSIKIVVFSVSVSISTKSTEEKLFKKRLEKKEGLHYLHESSTLSKIVLVSVP